MPFKRLNEPSGQVVAGAPKASADTGNRLVRKAILVHSGPNGEAMEFGSSDGAISFDDQRIRQVVEKNKLLKESLIEQYGGPDKTPIGAHQPILDQHSDDSNDRIRGRLTGIPYYEVMDVPKVGEKVSCCVCEITFLGQHAVEQVNDGRIYHLSVGIGDEEDEESYNSLGEVSTVIEPAAPGAMLLSKGKKLSKGEAMAKNKKLLAANKARIAKLSKIKEEMTGLSAKLVTSQKAVKLAARQGEIVGKMKKLSAAGKISPAEFKKMDFKKLASLPDDALTIVLDGFGALEPKVQPGQKGTSDASNFSDMGKQLEKTQRTRMKAEIKGDLKKLGAKVKMSAGEEGFDKEKKDKDLSFEEKADKKMAVEPADKKDLSAEGRACLEEMKSCLEAGDVEKAKEAHSKLSKHLEANGEKHLGLGDDLIPENPAADQGKSMGEMQQQIDELSTQIARIGGLIEEVMVAEKAEGHDLEGEQVEDQAHLEGEEDDNEDVEMSEEEKNAKKLADDKAKEEEDKKLAEEKAKVEKELGADKGKEGAEDKEKNKSGQE